MDLITPTVNLNGSSAESLIEQRLKVGLQLDKTIAALFEAMPHGRDYQTHSDVAAGNKAREAWRERIELLRGVRNDIMADAEAVHRQMPRLPTRRSSDG
jgi:hypothetical protein